MDLQPSSAAARHADPISAAAEELVASLHALDKHQEAFDVISLHVLASGGVWTPGRRILLRPGVHTSAHERLEIESALKSCEDYFVALAGVLAIEPCSTIGLRFDLRWSGFQQFLYISAASWGHGSRGTAYLLHAAESFFVAQDLLESFGPSPFLPPADGEGGSSAATVREIIPPAHRSNLFLTVGCRQAEKAQAGQNALRQILFLSVLCGGLVDIDNAEILVPKILPGASDGLDSKIA